MTDKELSEIEARAAAATAGPWWLERYDDGPPEEFSGISSPGRTHGICTTDSNVYGPSLADATFIAHARTDVPKLIAEVRRLREERVNGMGLTTVQREELVDVLGALLWSNQSARDHVRIAETILKHFANSDPSLVVVQAAIDILYGHDAEQ